MTSIEDFIAITQRIIEQDGFEEYLPTLLLDDEVLVLEGVPPDVDMETASLRWVEKTVEESDDYILAFKADANHFKVIARVEGDIEDRLVPVAGD